MKTLTVLTTSTVIAVAAFVHHWLTETPTWCHTATGVFARAYPCMSRWDRFSTAVHETQMIWIFCLAAFLAVWGLAFACTVVFYERQHKW